MEKRYETIIVGAGLAGLIAACYLQENGKKDIAIVASGPGGTPLVAAFNAILKDSPHGDSVEQYCEDMLKAGYYLGNEKLVKTFATYCGEAVELLERWGVRFTRQTDGYYRLRHASGSSCPRSLCRSDMLIGEHIADTLIKALEEKGVTFYKETTCLSLLTNKGHVTGVLIENRYGTASIYAKTVLAAWGGIGNLYTESTYPKDIDGRALAMAYQAGAKLIDLEFVEFEPMVSMEPPEAKGEPCPTAMLGEGAYLLNNKGERFLLNMRPQGEAGAPKSLINQAIWEEIEAGRGSPLGGVYVDLRHIDEATLKAYPWFYWREKDAGLDIKESLLQVGPMAHSLSGGMEVDVTGMSCVGGLFGAGEAIGGMHGACRMAGNAATQAAVSGLAAAKGILGYQVENVDAFVEGEILENLALREKNVPLIKEIVTRDINRLRNEKNLENAIIQLTNLYERSKEDSQTEQLALSGILLAKAALARTESRGTHLRKDFPKEDEKRYTVYLYEEKGEMKVERAALDD